MLEFRNIKFVYMAEGKIFSVTTDKTVENKRVKLTVENDDGIISARIDSVTPIKLLRLSAEFGYDFKSISRIFLNQKVSCKNLSVSPSSITLPSR